MSSKQNTSSKAHSSASKKNTTDNTQNEEQSNNAFDFSGLDFGNMNFGNMSAEQNAYMQDAINQATGMFGQWLQSVTDISKRMSTDAMRVSVGQGSTTGASVMYDLMQGWQKMASMMTSHPAPIIEQQMNLWRGQMHIWQNTMLTLVGEKPEPVIEPKRGDKRFKHEEWSKNPIFNMLKQNYLLMSDAMLAMVDSVEGIDEKTRQRLGFFTRQWINAVAPSNFLATNPEVLRLTMQTGGQNLIRGIKQLAEDIHRSSDVLNIRMTDNTAFEVGENLAVTPGKVVFQNHMFELLQYTPTTEKVHKRPLFLVPPWINKYYIMDLSAEKSFIRWAVAQGHTVFVMSWVNPTLAYRDTEMKTYMLDGVLVALEQIKAITGEPSVNAIGYCIGGMLLAMTLSWLQEHGQSDKVSSATYWATLFDFTDPGDIGVFVDESIVSAIERENNRKGLFDGRMMGVAFSLLRENDLYWNYFVQNYLKGEDPMAFDLLYWNSDCTNIPAPTHSFLLRRFYLENLLKEKGKLQLDDIQVDLSKVETPSFLLSTVQDHIAKWHGCYAGCKALGGDITFVLGESGHIAGVMNPPGGKYGYYTLNEYPDNPDEWFKNATKHKQSWWLEWDKWVQNYTDGQVAARHPGDNNWPVFGDAPGTYVKVKAAEAFHSEAVAGQDPTPSAADTQSNS